jgi:ribonuclease E
VQREPDAGVAESPAADAPFSSERSAPGQERRRRRGRRGGRNRRRQGGEEQPRARALTGLPAEPVPVDDEDAGLEAQRPDEARPGGARRAPGGGDAARARKRGSRGGRRRRNKKPLGAVQIEIIPGDDDELPELAELPDDAVLVGEPTNGPAAEKVATHVEDDLDDEHEPPRRSEPHKKRVILVNARDSEEKRVAVIEEGRIVDLQMTVKKHVSYVNDIYRGRVVNIESAIGAAFVDFGEGRNGFLHASDVLPSYGDPDWNLEKLLSTPVESSSEPESDSDDWTDGEKSADTAGAERDAAPEEASGHDDDHDHDHEHDDEVDGEPEDEPEDEPEQERAEPRRRTRGPRRAGLARQRTRLPIDKLLKRGQMVAVQITKDAIGDKGPTLTTYISIPGRYLVLMPSLERTGVSRKIDDERERRRLKRILQSLDIPEGMGVIVRTAGIGRTKTEIKRDLDYLLLAWEDFSKRLRSGRTPAPLYQESDVAIRTMRDLFTPETESVSVDDPEVFQRMIEFTKRLMPEHLERVKLHEGPRPLFHSHGVEQDFEKIFARRVELPSGGSIVIEQTEALVAIDVNSGRTREEGAEFEDIALKTNLEAVPEIARQIRLRDLGGIIVLDYIDMMRSSGRKAVERATRDALKTDRARAKIGRISQFGLLELTRQRLGPGLSKLVYDTCPRCRGSGRRRNASSRAQAIMRRLAAALALKGYTTVEVRTHPDVIEYLHKELPAEMAKLQELGGREIKLLSVPEQVEDSVLHYLRADGREVRPGGRRRR